MAESISLTRLSFALVPVPILLAWLWWDGQRLEASIQGLARMLIQLSLVGYVLVFLFESDQAWVTLATLTVMMLTASAIAIRTRRRHSWVVFGQVFLSVFLGGGVTLIAMTAGVLDLTPWYSPRVMIPLAGMTFSNCMNALSLAIERLVACDRTPCRLRSNASINKRLSLANSTLMISLDRIISTPEGKR